jgi:hypothetical protein
VARRLHIPKCVLRWAIGNEHIYEHISIAPLFLTCLPTFILKAIEYFYLRDVQLLYIIFSIRDPVKPTSCHPEVCRSLDELDKLLAPPISYTIPWNYILAESESTSTMTFGLHSPFNVGIQEWTGRSDASLWLSSYVIIRKCAPVRPVETYIYVQDTAKLILSVVQSQLPSCVCLATCICYMIHIIWNQYVA